MSTRQYSVKWLSLFAMLGLLLCSLTAMGAIEFPNADMEEDYDNNTIPDRWSFPASTQVQLVRDKTSHGGKAARFDEGYVLINHYMTATNLPGLNLAGRFDVAGSDGAELGLKLACFVEKNGNVEMRYFNQAWNRTLKEDYETIRFTCSLPTNAVRDRVWFGVYRSNNKGTVWLDDFHILSFRAKLITAEQKKHLIAMVREWRYLNSRLTRALEREPDSRILQELHQEVVGTMDQINRDDPDILDRQPEFDGRLHQIDGILNRTLSPGAETVAWLGDAYQRLEHNEIIPSEALLSTTLVSLGNEYQALGVTVANCLLTGGVVSVEIDGMDAFAEKVELRRQVYLMNYYEKERETIADPMPLLPGQRGKWGLALDPGEITKLYIGFKVKSGISGDYPVRIKVGGNLLHADIHVLAGNLPQTPLLDNFQFIYPSYAPAAEFPELNAEHMAQHYVTAIEFPFLPTVVFDSDGNIVKEKFAACRQARWMKAYTDHDIKLGLFWEGTFNRFPLEGGGSVPYEEDSRTPQWKNAYTNVLRAWMDFSRQSGIGLDHYWILTDDEPGSHAGWELAQTVELYELTQATEPGLKQFATINDYAMAQDVEAMLPYLDMAMPVWPYRQGPLPRTPAGYNPHTAFFETILPMMKAEREKRGMKIWSYSCTGGKKAGVLVSGRAYPVSAVGLGYTGVGYWAYNVGSGSTWDDTDGGLDYIFVYNGREKHPINERYNPTGEIIVTSIRWEGFRMGMQDAQILLYLKDRMEKGECDQDTTREIRALLKQAEEYGRERSFTFDGINSLSVKVRELVSKVR